MSFAYHNGNIGFKKNILEAKFKYEVRTALRAKYKS